MIAKALKAGAEGIMSGTAYHIKHSLDKHMQPTFLVFQLTDMCNARCKMCGIWKKKPGKELSAADLEKSIVKNKDLFKSVRWVNLTGGEPFLRTDYLDVFNVLSGLPKLEGIAIPSNGISTKTVVEKVKKSIASLREDRFLSVTLSIDGFEKTHDSIRGMKGAYKAVMSTLDELLKIKEKRPNFNVGVQPTITKLNIDEIEDFYKYMKKKTPSIGFAVSLESEGYYGNVGDEAVLSSEDKLRIVSLLRKYAYKDPQYAYYYTKLADLFESGKRDFICLAGYITMFLDPEGNLSVCPILSENSNYRFGNILTDYDLWFDDKAAKIKKRLKKEPECEHCSMMCDLINVAKVEFFDFSFFMLQHPKLLDRLIKKIRSTPNPYF